jgi:hypothetical protein
MDSTTVFLFFVFTCLGAAAGAFIQMRVGARKAKSAPPPPESPLAGEGDSEILRVWRSKSGGIWLEMDRSRLDDKGAIQAEQRRQLLNLVIELRPWLEMPAEALPPGAPQPRPGPLPSPTAPPAAAGSAVPVEKAAEQAKSRVNMKSIVQQIDDVLQAKLAGTVFSQQDIHLLESPEGGVKIQIDRETYAGVDAVPDPEIQALIRQAVAEWDKGPR